jgi:hypothetical protein
MITRRFSTTRLAALTVLSISVAIGSQAFVPSAYGCGTVNTSDCRTSTNGGGLGKSASGVMAFLEQVRLIVDAGSVMIP